MTDVNASSSENGLGDTERMPWCPSCEAFAVPTDDNECGECGTEVVFREAEA